MRGIATLFAFALLSAAGASSALAADPTLEVAPNLVFSGQTANVYGTGFCPTSPSCSTVTIAVETKQVASGVQVGSDGKFHATFTVNEFSGTHRVTASQNGAIQATAGMMVALTDTRKPTPTPAPPGGGGGNPPAPQTTASPPNPIGTAPPSDSPVADASPAVQPTATNGGPPSPATAAVNAPLNVGIAILLLLLVAAAVAGFVVWRRRRESR
jgi:hypothetical protein